MQNLTFREVTVLGTYSYPLIDMEAPTDAPITTEKNKAYGTKATADTGEPLQS